MTGIRKALYLYVLISILVLPAAADALDVVEDEGKVWETTLSLGVKDFNARDLDSAALTGIRLQKRLDYPFLIGLGMEGAVIGDVLYIEGNIPISIRQGPGPFKLDALVAPGIAYAENTSVGISQVIGVGTVGLEMKRFIRPGVSLGGGAYYSFHTNSDLNGFKFAFIIGF